VTGKEFSEVDFDRLADYVGGALDGTPEAAEVERLVTHDARWRAAHSELGAALDRVRGDLNLLGAAAETMPAEVVARLDVALRAEADEAAAASGAVAGVARHATRPPGRRSAAGRAFGAPAASGPARDGVGPPTRARTSSRRLTRWAGLTAAAAALVAFCGLGVNVLGGRVANDNRGDSLSAAGGGSDDAAREGQAPTGPGATAALPSRTQVSGADYRRETMAVDLRRKVSTLASQSAEGAEGRANKDAAPVPPSAADTSGAPAELRRLSDPADLSACLTAVTGGYPAPASVLLVDYARFEGQPALVVTFTDGAGHEWAVVAGPACGLSSAGADTRFTTRVL
jgi:hypothetical protein